MFTIYKNAAEIFSAAVVTFYVLIVIDAIDKRDEKVIFLQRNWSSKVIRYYVTTRSCQRRNRNLNKIVYRI